MLVNSLCCYGGPTIIFQRLVQISLFVDGFLTATGHAHAGVDVLVSLDWIRGPCLFHTSSLRLLIVVRNGAPQL